MNARRIIGLLVVAVLAAVGGLAASQSARPVDADRIVARDQRPDGSVTVTLMSRRYLIDRLYPSMRGPRSEQMGVELWPDGRGRLVYLTGVDVVIVGDDGEPGPPQDLFCHSNLTLAPATMAAARRTGDGVTPSMDDRLATLVPGRMSLKLPDGFGLPVWADETINNYTMALNLADRGESLPIRMRTRIDFMPAAAAAASTIRPLFRRAIYAYESTAGKPDAICHSKEHGNMACGPARGVAASDRAFVKVLGEGNTVHWLIPPGPFVSRIGVTEQLAIDEPTTVHYVTGHLHPHGRSLALHDKTTGVTLFSIASRGYVDRPGVAKMDEWSSEAGVTIDPTHEYELVTTYANPTTEPIDAMSILYLYAADRRFEAGR